VKLPIDGVEFVKGKEYAFYAAVSGTPPFAAVGPQYDSIPRNVAVRLVVDGQVGDLPWGRFQEFFVFSDPREVRLTLRAPAGGAGVLEIGVAENTGTVRFENLVLHEGCADVMVRRFEHGLAALNGSRMRAATIDLENLYPGARFRRLSGSQDPVVNSGASVAGVLILPPQDGLFLLEDTPAQGESDD